MLRKEFQNKRYVAMKTVTIILESGVNLKQVSIKCLFLRRVRSFRFTFQRTLPFAVTGAVYDGDLLLVLYLTFKVY